MMNVQVMYKDRSSHVFSAKAVQFDTNSNCWIITTPNGGLIIAKDEIITIGYENIVEKEENVDVV